MSILWTLDVARMATITTVRLNALIWIKKVYQDLVEDGNIIILTSRVWALNPHKMTGQDVNAKLISQRRLSSILV
jgi:DNA-directed RNA polymerase delta subunit